VKFGTSTATCGGGSNFFVVGDTEIFVTTPADTAGTVDVVVDGPGGSSPIGPADKFTYTSPAVATVNGISPNSGTTGGGTQVILHGSGFETATAVMFGSARVAAFPSGDTTLFVTSPAGTAGTVDLIVVNPAGPSATSNADKFTYVAPGGPVVQALSPNHGTAAGGTRLVIIGTGFTNATAVHFGATAVPSGGFSVFDDSHIVVSATPPGTAATTVNVTVTTSAGTSAGSNGDRFSYLAATAPMINGVVVNSGPSLGGTFVEIIGSGFTGATSVMFGTHAGAGVSVSDDTDLFVTSPAAPVGTVDITITTPVATSSIVTADKFTFQTLSAPVIYGVSPHTGITSGNTQVTIYGSGFNSGSTVRFGTNAASSAQAFDTVLYVQSPAGSAGTLDITITNPAGTSVVGPSDRFTYLAPGAPLVQTVTPNRGVATGGQSIYLVGTGFTGATSVQFGTAVSTSFYVFNDTQLYAQSPAGTSGATVDITVTTPVGTSAASNADKFTYFTPVAPTVTAVSPSSGPASGGTTVWVTGTGFSVVSAVNFGTSAASQFKTQSDTVIEIMGSPAGTSGSTIDITVVTPGGTSTVTTADHFNYTVPVAPVIHAVSPSSGPANGNTTVYITGTAFSGASAINFGAAASPSFFVESDGTVITATSPVGTNGTTVDIRVVTSGGTSAITTNDQFTYTAAVTPPAPTVSAVSPNTGDATVGTTVYISGIYLTGATQVFFSGVAAAVFSVLGDNLVYAISPSGTAGTTVDVTVTTPSGTSATGSADKFTYSTPPVPVVTGVSPATGPSAGGTTVFVTGSGFNGLTGVSFGVNAAPTGYALSDTLAYAISPAGTATVDITITTAGGTSATSANDRFVYGGPNPSGLQVNGVTSNAGPTAGGTGVQIFGMGFTGATAVSFGTAPAQSFFVSGDGNISAVSPAGTAGSVDVTVTAGGSTSAATSADSFTYLAPGRPVVDGLEPNRGSQAGGDSITIFGSDLAGATAVHFGSVAAPFFTSFGTEIFTSSPPGSGMVDVTVTTSAGTSAISAADAFTYLAPGPPVVNAVDPASGSAVGGTSVVMFGSGFTGTTAVAFNGTAASSFYAASDTALFVTSPPGTAGTTVDITVTTPVGTSPTSNADKFTFIVPPVPAVNAVTPGRGGTNGGNQIDLFGSGFSGTTAVHFGTTLVAVFGSVLDDMLQVTSPAGAPGIVDITVTTPGGVSAVNAGDKFTYYTAPAPTVTAVSPTSGRAGALVYVTGTGLGDATAVLFGSACTPFYFTYNATDTSISINAPAGPVGTVDVRVVTPEGTSAVTVADQFTYLAPLVPSVTAVAPAGGPSAGGTTVFITGSGLAGVTSVSFGSTPASSFGAIDDGLVEVSSPAGASGSTVDVQVTTPGGTSAATSADRFTWGPTPTPSVSVVSPNSGPSGGGSDVLVTGTGFSIVTQMHVGSTVLNQCFGSGFGGGTPAAAAPIVALPTRVPSIRMPVATRLPIHRGATGVSSVPSTPTFATVLTPSAPVLLKPARKPAAKPAGSASNSAATPASKPAATRAASGGVSASTAVGDSLSVYCPSGYGFAVLSDNLVDVISPPQGSMPSTVDVTATSAGGTSTTSSADRFTYTATPAPAVTAVSPSGGGSAGGTTVYISGTNLTSPTTVKFGTVSATILPVSFFVFQNLAGDSLIAVTSPAGTNPSTVDVTVTTAGGTSATSTADHFTYGATPAPSVSAVGPASGPIGTDVFVTGSGFLGSTAVDYGTVRAGFAVISDTLIEAPSPSNPPGVVDVRVVTPGGTSSISTADNYTYSASPTPVVSAVGPASGPAGTTVYITGSGLTDASAVAFGAATASTFTLYSDTLVEVSSPAGSGTVDVRVTTPGGTSATSSSDHYSYSLPPPEVAVLPAMANAAYGGYTTAATIQNTGSAPANIQIVYYDQTGAQVGAGDAITGLPANASWTVRQDNGNSFALGSAGSAVVYSSQPVAAFVNEFAPGNVGDATSYTGVQAPSGVGATLYAATIVNNAYGGYTTGIGLLNAGSSPTNVTITYRDGAGAVIKTQTVTGLAAHAYQALYSGAAGLPSGFAGTATITSSTTQPLGAIVNETGPGGQFSSYDAVPSGSTTLDAPAALRNAFGGYNTGMGIVNTTGSAGTVTINYYDSSGTPTATTHPIAANGSLGVYQGTDIPSPGAYTAVITSTVAIAAIVNEVAPAGGAAQQSTSYNTFSAGSASLHLPLVENAGSDPWNTGEGIMNTGTGSTTVTVNYYATGTGTAVGTTQTLVLAPHAFWGLYQPSGGLPGGTRATAVVTTSSGGQVAVICNESSTTTFMSYDGQ
jgi:hypothetical protein